jgi:hypothetical protein
MGASEDEHRGPPPANRVVGNHTQTKGQRYQDAGGAAIANAAASPGVTACSMRVA